VLACRTTVAPASCSVRATDYDQSCNVDTDCVAVTEVYGCGECACQTGAINTGDLARYQAALAGAESSAATGCLCPCEASAPQCCGGVCTNLCSACAPDAAPE
jgi:hypothetical protein